MSKENAERKEQLFEEMLAWICEHVSGQEDLYLALCERIGMTKDELHEYGITDLDLYFSEKELQELLWDKLCEENKSLPDPELSAEQSGPQIEIWDGIMRRCMYAYWKSGLVPGDQAKTLLQYKTPLRIMYDKYVSLYGANRDERVSREKFQNMLQSLEEDFAFLARYETEEDDGKTLLLERVDVPENERPEFLGQIVDVFEDFLAEKGIQIQNPEKQEAVSDGEDLDTIAILYGTDYGNVENKVAEIMRRWGVFQDDEGGAAK